MTINKSVNQRNFMCGGVEIDSGHEHHHEDFKSKFRWAIKVSVVSVLCLTVLVVRHYSARSRHCSPAKNTAAAREKEIQMYERQIRRDEARIEAGLGKGGRAVLQLGDSSYYKEMKAAAERTFGFNAYLSDRMPYHRRLKDHRHPKCRKVIYDKELPSASVVIVMRRVPLSTVLRAVYGTIRAAKHGHHVYLKEIILVDDNSTLPELKGKLSHYVRTRLPPDLIKILRLTRENSSGVADARLAGARAARGDVLVFLDAHCEPLRDWLRPLLARIKRRRRAVVAPVADVVDPATFEYKPREGVDLQVGGFTFAGEFTWFVVSDREVERRGPSDIAPTRTPTLPAGVFAVDRLWFWRAGGYDNDMRGSGYESLELSLRMWMCGGELEIVPCSRVGQISIKDNSDNENNKDYVAMNIARTAEVWMDDYKELLYLIRPDLKGILSESEVRYRRVVRRRLRCRSFAWYLHHVYPEKFVPVRDTYGFVRFRNAGTQQCLTLPAEALGAPLGLVPCRPDLTPSQLVMLSLKGELRDERRCAEIQFSPIGSGNVMADMESDATYRVVMIDCQFRTSNAAWRYVSHHRSDNRSGRLEHVDTGLCLQAWARPDAPAELRAAQCMVVPEQTWSAELLLGPERGLTKKQLASLQSIRSSDPAAAALRDRPSTDAPYSTTGRIPTLTNGD